MVMMLLVLQHESVASWRNLPIIGSRREGLASSVHGRPNASDYWSQEQMSVQTPADCTVLATDSMRFRSADEGYEAAAVVL
ncbi:hypothetical protein ElyMa_002722400 [Elysia marginata]|uniref:Uncharacterized protein n=1 Tax=Elysia marginata TaxID=1093978 RepID=A0AAV4HIG4_9GAST|nr:hypothetical protein ElyMa_002722400 [Elysia marginata]